MQVLEESDHKNRVAHINESVANIAIVLQVDWQVEEVVATLVLGVNTFEEHLLGVLVRNVLDHYRGAQVVSLDYLLQVQLE